MDIQAVNHHLEAMSRAANGLAMDAQAQGRGGNGYLNLVKSQHNLLTLMIREIGGLQKQIDELKAGQAGATPAG